MVKRKSLSWLILAAIFTVFPLHASDEFSLKATFLYRFAQFTHWPPPPRGELRFCVLHHQQLLTALQALPINIDAKAIDDVKSLQDCDVLMLGLSERSALQKWQRQLAGRQLLIVTDNAEAYRQLGMIQLLTSPDGVSFQINLQRASAHQLKLGSQLLKLAQQVD